jgi:hypothetical protein
MSLPLGQVHGLDERLQRLQDELVPEHQPDGAGRLWVVLLHQQERERSHESGD